jgi:RNA polymerase sigma factor (sigma-70 family)
MRELIEAIKGGDADRLGELYSLNRGLLYKLSARYVGIDNAVTRDDLMQAGFLGLCEAVRAWEPERGAWSTVAFNYARKAMRDAVGLRGTRRRAHLGAVSLDEPLPGGEDGDTARIDMLADENACEAGEGVIRDEMQEVVRDAVARLSPERGEVVRFHDLEGLTYKQAGERMGISAEYAHNIRGYALRDLRRDKQLTKALDDETRFHAHKGVTAFLNDWTSVTEGAALWRIERGHLV